MNEKNMLGNFIYELRKEKGYSQSELGDLVGVSNKAVSKWETLEANPDSAILKRLAEVLGVSVDELLSCERSAEIEKDDLFFGLKGKVTHEAGGFEFVSKYRTKKGTPYVHINVGRNSGGKVRRARGIIAVGNIASGIISLGLISRGILSVGLIALGLVSVAPIAIGLLVATGAIALGLGVSVGAVAVGTLAVGAVAVGVMSIGGVSIGVFAHTGINGFALGYRTFIH